MNTIEMLVLAAPAVLPVAMLAALNLALALSGERGTLLLPSLGSRLAPRTLRAESLLPATGAVRAARDPANEPDFRRAA